MITINLLPEEYKKEFAYEKTKRFFTFVFLSLYFIVIVFSLLLFGAYFFLKVELSTWQEKIDAEKTDEKVKRILGLEETIKLTNKKIQTINNAKKEKTEVSKLIESIIPAVGDRIYLTSLSLNADAKKVSLSGFALSRDDVLKFESFLKNSQFVKEGTLVSPKSNILKRENIDFQFSFNIK